MKDTPQDLQSFDDAFDAHCRDVLSQRSVPAPPFVPLAAPTMGTGKKVILAAGAAALLAAGSFLWTADESAPVPPPVSTEAPVNPASVETLLDVPADVTPVDAETPVAQEAVVEVVAIEETTTSSDPAPTAAKPLTESAEAIESTPIMAVPQSAASMETDVNDLGTLEAAPEAVEVKATHEVGTEPNGETPVEDAIAPAQKNAQQPDAEKAPVLTLPITLPAGGGH